MLLMDLSLFFSHPIKKRTCSWFFPVLHWLVGLKTNLLAFVKPPSVQCCNTSDECTCKLTTADVTAAESARIITPLMQTSVNVVHGGRGQGKAGGVWGVLYDICSYSPCNMFGCFSIRNDSRCSGSRWDLEPLWPLLQVLSKVRSTARWWNGFNTAATGLGNFSKLLWHWTTSPFTIKFI